MWMPAMNCEPTRPTRMVFMRADLAKPIAKFDINADQKVKAAWKQEVSGRRTGSFLARRDYLE
jgi:hypothetical protein